MKSKLGDREKEVLAWIAEGKTAEETATILGISRRTVEWHIQNARRKVQATNIVHAVAMAVRYGIIGICGTGICGVGIAVACQSPTLRKVMLEAVDFDFMRALLS